MNHSFEAFMGQFVFDPGKAGLVGVERELLIRETATGQILPISPEILARIWGEHPHLTTRIKAELSRCQLEETTDPVRFGDVADSLRETSTVVAAALARVGCEPQYSDIGPADMPLDVYPEARYVRIAEQRPREQLSAACRSIGVHVHVGMPDAAKALQAYNFAVRNLHSLRKRADRTDGRRMALYRTMVPEPEPITFNTWHEHYRHAVEHGYAGNTPENSVRNNWMLVRISRYGTIEFRLFDGVDDVAEIESIAKECRALCRTFFD